MRKENLLNVDVRTHAQRAADRTATNGKLHRIFDNAEVLPLDTVTFAERIKRLFPSPEVLDVAGRPVNGFVVPTWAAGVLLAAVIGCMGFMYNQISGQRDMLIRLDTQLQERDRHELEYRSEFKNQLNVQKVYIDNMTNQLNTIRGLLTQNQLRMIERGSQPKEQNHAPRSERMPRM